MVKREGDDERWTGDDEPGAPGSLIAPALSLLLLSLLLLITVANIDAVGVGVVPSRVSIADATRGGEYEQVVNVYNTDTMATSFRIYATGELQSWISFHDLEGNRLTEMSIPGKSHRKVLMVFKIPGDAPSGSYNSTVYVESIPAPAQGGTRVKGATAHVGIQVPVEVSIQVTGEENLSGIVQGVTAGDTEQGYPLMITVLFRNTGNVIARPVIEVAIYREGADAGAAPVSSFYTDDEMVKPHAMKEITLTWDTDGHPVGDYRADVAVSLAGKLLNRSEIPFKILERGALTRSGIFRSLSYEGKPEVGGWIKVLATFENTGMISTKAKFSGEVYRDGELVGVIKSEELEVPVRESRVLTSYLKLDAPGEYNISGYVLYEGKKTGTRDIQLELTQGGRKSRSLLPWIDAPGTLIALLLSILILLIYRRRGVKNRKV